jgi:GNAT superfamily N-acetyltransferase
MSFDVYEITDDQRENVKSIIEKEWGSPVAVRGRLLYPEQHRGFYCTGKDGEFSGLITFCIKDDQCEIVTLNSFLPNLGVGTKLVRAVQKTAKEEGCLRYWLITTNDNVDAIRFYQIKGFHLAAIYKDSVSELRKIKPSIPETGEYGIPIRDEIELEMFL